ncbi:NAD(P)/FAD-dependent oxidoreductase [Rickettsiales bacterium]|nr:NAD(P)/FAD-dependent oxidoreductase [Rickettsiales bacterium]
MTHNKYDYDVAVIGAGPVGLFAITSCGMMGMSTVCIDSMPFVGGQCVALYPQKKMRGIPGFIEENGEEFVEKLIMQTNEFNTKFLLGNSLDEIQKIKDGFVINSGTTRIVTKAVIIASGKGLFKPNKLAIDNAENFENKSVFYSIKNKHIFKDKVVCVAGGGDSAGDWCVELADIASKIILIHRRSKFRFFKKTQETIEKLVEEGKIELMTPYKVHDIKGEDGMLNEIDVLNIETGSSKSIKADYLLPFFGMEHKFNAFSVEDMELVKGKIKIDNTTMETSCKGIYSIGDSCYYEGKLPLIVVGFSECTIAANSIYHMLNPDSKNDMVNVIIK